jgi:antitoxin VapB
MGVNRKSPEAHENLEQRLATEKAGLAARLFAIGKGCAPRLGEPFKSSDHNDLLYDESGLPR